MAGFEVSTEGCETGQTEGEQEHCRRFID